MNLIGGGILVFLDTFCSPILFIFFLPILIVWFSPIKISNNINEKESCQVFFQPFLFYLLFFSLNTICTTIFVYTQRRALMVWRVFAPKYIFEVFLFIKYLFFNLNVYRVYF